VDNGDAIFSPVTRDREMIKQNKQGRVLWAVRGRPATVWLVSAFLRHEWVSRNDGELYFTARDGSKGAYI